MTRLHTRALSYMPRSARQDDAAVWEHFFEVVAVSVVPRSMVKLLCVSRYPDLRRAMKALHFCMNDYGDHIDEDPSPREEQRHFVESGDFKDSLGIILTAQIAKEEG